LWLEAGIEFLALYRELLMRLCDIELDPIAPEDGTCWVLIAVGPLFLDFGVLFLY
jgi:hypothetical protein